MHRLLGFYAPDFQSHQKKPLSEWATVLQAESQALRPSPCPPQGQVLPALDGLGRHHGGNVRRSRREGARTGPIRRQYWTRRGQQWQIFFEGVIG